MALDKDHITRDAYNAVYSLVTNSIADTQSPSRPITNWCFSTFPMDKGNDILDYPIIIFHPASYRTENWTIIKTKANLSMTIEVFMAGNKGAKYADDVTDNVVSIIMGARYATLRNINRMFDTEIDSIEFDSNLMGKIRVHARAITFTFNYKFT
jgi:hypothetical protein